jgi:hypothetical protein
MGSGITPARVGAIKERRVSMKKLGEDKPVEGGFQKADEGADNIGQVKARLDAQPKYKIMVPSTELDREDVKVGICGYTYQIQRDKPVSVPESVVKVLQQAVVTSYKQVPRKEGEGYDLVPFESMRYPFQIII